MTPEQHDKLREAALLLDGAKYILQAVGTDGDEVSRLQAAVSYADRTVALLRGLIAQLWRPRFAPGYPELPGGPYEHPGDLLPRLAPTPCGTTLLEVGVGGGIVGEPQWRGRGVTEITCIDAWAGCTQPNVIVCAAQDALGKFGPDAFDVVQCCEMIEHCTKADGLKILADLKKLARRFVALTCPLGFTVQDPALAPSEPWAANPFQKHISAWVPEDFLDAGYQVYLNGEHPETKSHAGAQLVAYAIR